MNTSERATRVAIILCFAIALATLLVIWGLIDSFPKGIRTAEAAPLRPQQSCRADVITQHDMTGRYESRNIMLEVYPCGGSLISWMNQYSERQADGQHQAVYFAGDRLPGGGVVAFGYVPDPEINAYLDGNTSIAIKPAERGWVQLITITDQGQINRIYRLQKTE